MQKALPQLTSALVWALALSLFAYAHIRGSRAEAHDRNEALQVEQGRR